MIGARRAPVAIVALAASASLVLSACGGGDASPGSSDAPGAAAGEINPDAIIEAGISYSLSGGFDPMVTTGAVTVAANWHTLEGLTELDPVTREVYAALGAELPEQKDDTTYEVDLRDGAVFHAPREGRRHHLLSDSAARVTALSSGTISAMESVPYIDVDGLAKQVDVETVQSFGLATAADLHVDLRAGQERSVAATKTYTNELLASFLLVEAVAGATGAAAGVPAAAQAALASRDQVADVARALVVAPHLVTTARGYGHATAREGALKLMETCHLPTLAFSAADLLHGPFAMLGEGVPALALLDRGPAAEGMSEIVARLVETGAPTYTFGAGPTSPVAGTAGHVEVDHTLPAELAPIVDVVPLQLLALELSRLRGLDADTPRSLRKVTATL